MVRNHSPAASLASVEFEPFRSLQVVNAKYLPPPERLAPEQRILPLAAADPLGIAVAHEPQRPGVDGNRMADRIPGRRPRGLPQWQSARCRRRRRRRTRYWEKISSACAAGCHRQRSRKIVPMCDIAVARQVKLNGISSSANPDAAEFFGNWNVTREDRNAQDMLDIGEAGPGTVHAVQARVAGQRLPPLPSKARSTIASQTAASGRPRIHSCWIDLNAG